MRLSTQPKEFNAIFDSLAPLLKDDLERIDHRLRTIWSEARTFGVRKDIIEREMNKRFMELFLEVAKGNKSA